MSNVQEALIREFADATAQRMASSVVASLRKITDTLSGDDSGLVNAWEEICVQVQGEESFDWETYREIMNDFVHAELETLSHSDLAALWLQTDDGSSWHSDNESLEMNRNAGGMASDAGKKARAEVATPEHGDEISMSDLFDSALDEVFGDEPVEAVARAYVPYELPTIVEYIVDQHLLPMADTFSNRNIKAYLNDESSDEEEDEEENDDEDEDPLEPHANATD